MTYPLDIANITNNLGFWFKNIKERYYVLSPLLVESWTKCRRNFSKVGILSGYQHVTEVFSNFSFFPGSYVLEYAACRIYSANGGMMFFPETRSLRYSQKEMPCLRQVFFRLVKVSRHRRPESLRVLPLIFLFFTYSRISLSLKLL